MRDPLDRIADICREQPHDALTQIATVLGFPAEEPKPTLREDAMYDMGFQRGVKHGWNLCVADDHEGYARSQASSEHVRVLRDTSGVKACDGGEA